VKNNFSEMIRFFLTPTSGAMLLIALAACNNQTTALRDSFALKKQAAATIGNEIGLHTTWNTIYPCDVGRVYQRVIHTDGTFGLMPYSPEYVSVVNAPSPLTTNDPISQTWQMSVTGKANVELQVGYMGLGADISGSNVRSVTFSASGDKHTYVTDEPGFQKFLNDTSHGTDVIDAVKSDQRTRNAANQNAPLPKYYIVTDVLSAKNVTVTLSASTSAALKVSTTDAAAVAAFAGFPISGAVSVSVSQDGSTSISCPESAALVGICAPLIWNSGKKEMEVDLARTLLYANGVAHDARAVAGKTYKIRVTQ
jgi:hypothetical protein